MGEERLMRAEVREKINKIVIYTRAGLMQSKFWKYCVNLVSLSILRNFAPTDVCALTHTFHITDREMPITPHDFHRITGLQFES